MQSREPMPAPDMRNSTPQYSMMPPPPGPADNMGYRPINQLEPPVQSMRLSNAQRAQQLLSTIRAGADLADPSQPPASVPTANLTPTVAAALSWAGNPGQSKSPVPTTQNYSPSPAPPAQEAASAAGPTPVPATSDLASLLAMLVRLLSNLSCYSGPQSLIRIQSNQVKPQ